VAETDLTPPLSWSKVSFINHMNAWKDGRDPDANVSLDEDGNQVRGLVWRAEVSADVFECASTRVPRLHPDEPGQEPTATSLHEGAPGRNQHKTTRKVRWRLEGNQEPPPRQWGWSREAGES